MTESTGGRQQFSTRNVWSHSHYPSQAPEESPEIEVVHAGDTTTIVPLIPSSRMSQEFRKYLEELKTKTKLCPDIFPEKDWKVPKPKDEKTKIITLGGNDIATIWKEVWGLARKYNYSVFRDWMPIYYFLVGCVLKAKIEYLEKERAKETSNKTIVKILADTERMVMYEYVMMTELAYTYVERVAADNRMLGGKKNT